MRTGVSFALSKANEKQRHPGRAFRFPADADQAAADTADEEGDATMQPNEIEHFVDVRKPVGGEEKESRRSVGRRTPPAPALRRR